MKSIPDMGATRIGEFLTQSAASSDGEVVEVGSWLGAGTSFLAQGVSSREIRVHAYDRWKVSAQEVKKAQKWGLTLIERQDSLPVTREYLGSDADRVCFHKGELRQAQWHAKPIGLYVDDAAKTADLFNHSLRVFSPFWVEGAVLVMMDFHYYLKAGARYRYQFEVFSSFEESFTPVTIPGNPSESHAAFRFSRATGAFTRWVSSLSYQSA